MIHRLLTFATALWVLAGVAAAQETAPPATPPPANAPAADEGEKQRLESVARGLAAYFARLLLDDPEVSIGALLSQEGVAMGGLQVRLDSPRLKARLEAARGLGGERAGALRHELLFGDRLGPIQVFVASSGERVAIEGRGAAEIRTTAAGVALPLDLRTSLHLELVDAVDQPRQVAVRALNLHLRRGLVHGERVTAGGSKQTVDLGVRIGLQRLDPIAATRAELGTTLALGHQRADGAFVKVELTGLAATGQLEAATPFGDHSTGLSGSLGIAAGRGSWSVGAEAGARLEGLSDGPGLGAAPIATTWLALKGEFRLGSGEREVILRPSLRVEEHVNPLAAAFAPGTPAAHDLRVEAGLEAELSKRLRVALRAGTGPLGDTEVGAVVGVKLGSLRKIGKRLGEE